MCSEPCRLRATTVAVIPAKSAQHCFVAFVRHEPTVLAGKHASTANNTRLAAHGLPCDSCCFVMLHWQLHCQQHDRCSRTQHLLLPAHRETLQALPCSFCAGGSAAA